MNIGQRIDLIKKLAKRLGKGSYSEGDLILRQFGIPWSEGWQGSGSSGDYYLDMLEQGEEDKLVELHGYLFPGDPLPGLTTPSGSGHWSPGTLRLFISHSSKKKEFVAQIKEELSEYGVECFVAHEDIRPTKEWLTEIRTALNTCHAFVAILCNNFKESDYCDQEAGFALQRGILVIPVRLEADPHGFMAPLQGVAAFGKEPRDIAVDIRTLIWEHSTTKALADAVEMQRLENIVEEFLSSTDFGTSTRLLKKLEHSGEIPMHLAQKIADNWYKNREIYGCMGIPRRMEAFLGRHGLKSKLVPARS